MAQRKNRRTFIIVVSAVVAVVLILTFVLIVNGIKGKEKDPYAQKNTDTTKTSSTDTPSSDEAKPTEKITTPEQPDMDNDAKNLDPATIGVIEVTPMSLAVSYVKGIGSFSYNVSRTSDGRHSVDFSNEGLVGTKCTNDSGIFASILESPNDNEKATVTKTVTVKGGVQYGLSLSSSTCTSDSALLQKYQDSFTKAFSLLKRTD